MAVSKIETRVLVSKLERLEESFKNSLEMSFENIVREIVKECKENHNWLNDSNELGSSIVGAVFRGGRFSTYIVSSPHAAGSSHPIRSKENRAVIGEHEGRAALNNRNVTAKVRYTGGQQLAAVILAGAPYAVYLEGKISKSRADKNGKSLVLHVVSDKQDELRKRVNAAITRIVNLFKSGGEKYTTNKSGKIAIHVV